MGEREESVARAFVSAWCGEAYGEAEIARQLDVLSDDICFHVYAWERPVIGRDAVREELVRQTEMGIGGIRSEILTMASVDKHGLLGTYGFDDVSREAVHDARRCRGRGERRREDLSLA